MTDDEPLAQFMLHLEAPGADTEEIDRLTRQLHGELAELDVEPVELPPGKPLPEGAKGLPLATQGELAVAMRPGVLPDFIGFLRNWLSRQSQQVDITTTIGSSTFHIKASVTDVSAIMQALNSISSTPQVRSGGVDLNADQSSVGGDVTGRDKMIISIQAEPGATVIVGQSDRPAPDEVSPSLAP